MSILFTQVDSYTRKCIYYNMSSVYQIQTLSKLGIVNVCMNSIQSILVPVLKFV